MPQWNGLFIVYSRHPGKNACVLVLRPSTIQQKSITEINYDLRWIVIYLAPVVQTLDSAIHRINRYPTDKCQGNQLRYPVDSNLSGG